MNELTDPENRHNQLQVQKHPKDKIEKYLQVINLS